ncbi:MAG: hypothetical protein HC897_01340 [Thermoanaerobaculia bacterium]|nr:hypothetical protein [Thermoanaerobaculia bacterium]
MKREDNLRERDMLASHDLANLLVDALLRSGLVAKHDVARAVEIVTEEIEVRKALGDY